MGTEDQSATKLLGCFKQWVKTEPVLQVEKFGLWISTKCPVQIPSLGPQCPGIRSPSDDPTTESIPTSNTDKPDKPDKPDE